MQQLKTNNIKCIYLDFLRYGVKLETKAQDILVWINPAWHWTLPKHYSPYWGFLYHCAIRRDDGKT